MNWHIVNKLTKIVGFIVAALVLVSAGQVAQYLASCQDARTHAINEWVKANPSNKTLADTFASDCLGSVKTRDRSMETKVTGVYECGDSLGMASLVEHVKEADSIMVTVSWPLSLIE
ncbi:MAG: hypothetical protein EOO52_13160 [Gammaproteobacteria bacterium]|nr:MAG: hypothetical protein EOO52_13160 [Gammaproteobacteria bacterium]